MLRSFVVNKMAGITAGRQGMGFSLLFFLKNEGRPQPVRWSRPPSPTSAVYQKEKEKTRERRSLKKPLYMHYPKAAQRVRLFAWEKYVSFIMAVKGSGGSYLLTFESASCFPAGKTYLKRAAGGVVMLIWLLFPTGGRRINTSSRFTITYYTKEPPHSGRFFRAKPMWNHRCFARETRAKQ